MMDFAKAFNKVPYQCLLSKLHHYGIEGTTLDSVSYLLHGQTQTVMVNVDSSVKASVISGLPKGSVLGPILFLCYINDLLEQVSSLCHLFADDSIFYREFKRSEDSMTPHYDPDALEA